MLAVKRQLRIAIYSIALLALHRTESSGIIFIRGVVCELEEYYKEVIERASSKDNLLKLYVFAGKAEAKK